MDHIKPLSLFPNPTIIAHRGASLQAPENTLPAFILAASQGARWVEFDVSLTADHQPIVFHDETLERTSNGVGYLADHSYAQLQKLDAGSWFSAEFKATPIPHLQQVLQTCQQYHLQMNLEIKPSRPQDAEQTCEKILATVAEYWPSSAAPLLYSSFSKAVLQIMHAREPSALLGALFDNWDQRALQFAESLQITRLHLSLDLATHARIQNLTQAGFEVLVYTVNSLSIAHQLFDSGVKAIFSDKPNLLQEIK